MSTAKGTRPTVVDEDVDDLDDLLDQFTLQNPTKASGSSAAATTTSSGTGTSGPTKPVATPKAKADLQSKLPASLQDLDINDDFARELAEGMASLMREIAAESGEKPEEGLAGSEVPSTQEQLAREAAFRKAWEDMLVQDMNGALDTDDFSSNGAGTKGKMPLKPGAKPESEQEGPVKTQVKEDKFQESIRRAMQKMKESDSALHAESASGADPFDALLNSLGEGGADTEEEIQGLLESMMSQIMSKDILYEPLKELSEKFPQYLEDNAATLKPEDKKRYESQQRVVKEVLAVYDDPSYSPENQEQALKVVNLMNAMQTFGSPPQEIMGPLPPGMELGPDGMPELPESCIVA